MKKRILIVDDDPTMKQFLDPLFSKKNYNAVFAGDGLEALEKVEEQIPDLIISDIMMPLMDGFTFYRHLQSEPKTADIPFIFLSSKDNPTDQLKALKAGADEYLTKPFDLQDLFDSIQKVLANAVKVRSLSERVDFSGNLAELKLEDVIQVIDMNQKTGELVFLSPEYNNIGTAFFENGNLVNAKTESLNGIEAFLDLSTYTNGFVMFYRKAINVPQKITKETMSVLFEAARFRDEGKTLYNLVSDTNTQLQLVSKKINPELIENFGIDYLSKVLQMIEKNKSIKEIVQSGVISRPRTETILVELLNAGIVKKV